MWQQDCAECGLDDGPSTCHCALRCEASCRPSLLPRTREPKRRRRDISLAVAEAVARSPEQRWLVRPGRELRQSRIVDPASGKLQLLRVFEDSQVLEIRMKVNYDAETDTLTVIFRDVPVAESDEEKPGVILDYDAAGNIVSIEVLDASRRVEEPHKVTVLTR
jgi:YD repeat-containing protein